MSLNSLSTSSLSLNSAIETHFLSADGNTSLIDVLAMISRLRNRCSLSSHDLENDPQLQEFLTSGQTQLKEGRATVTSLVSSCVLVIEQEKLIGVFTERDIVKLTATGTKLTNLTLKDVINSPAIALKESETHDLFNAISLLRQHELRHLPIVDQSGKPIGIVTQESIRRSLQPINLLTKLRYVRDVMTNDVIYATPDTSILELAQLMTKNRISCIVICQTATNSSAIAALTPIGIVTERDIVQFQALEIDLQHNQAKIVMSAPLFTVTPQDSLWVAHQTMNQQRVRRLVVVGQQGQLVGIVSQSSLLQVFNPAEMYGIIDILQDVVDQRTFELEIKNQQLSYEIQERKKAEFELKIAHDQLQKTVAQQTKQLREANLQLQQDLEERHRVETALRESEQQLKQQTQELQQTLETLKHTQLKLIQTEKMSSLGQLVAGVAHEVNNPINFIFGNLTYAEEYVNQLLDLIQLYHQNYPNPPLEIQAKIESIDFNFLKQDVIKLIDSMKEGAERIRKLIISMRNFSRLDESNLKTVDIHEGIESTLVLLQNKLQPRKNLIAIEVIKNYGDLPKIECYPGQLNQVFINLLSNAIDALSPLVNCHNHHLEKLQHSPQNLGENLCFVLNDVPIPKITVTTNYEPQKQTVMITIADNGQGMTEEVRKKLFDPFFTTKPVGQGTGLGLSISYQIVVHKHGGNLECVTKLNQGTEFIIEIPCNQSGMGNGE